ncbi:Na+:solute symporter [Membranicola marinus]|uniref:Na+:solute symporter n=1 Tax=Membranihabitans marinus TaxID=1227546 RepID=A0A953HWQ1_9BACT|nr:sodium:solute symporter family protein [Membranihabitans marinus]MBY5959178.1 Na+:solute symporter [Membranihabitans marinus]
MSLSQLDWLVIILFLIVLAIIGFVSGRGAGKNTESYFLSGRNTPWWLLGISMVATTFSLGTPNLVADIVRTGGVEKNWLWWSFLLTGLLTVFVYAKLWNRSKILTDLEFYEIRYSGKAAAFLRGFRAIYLGLFFNILVLASASLAFIKISSIMLGINPVMPLIIVGLIVTIYSTIGGLKSVLWTDLFQFSFAIGGSIYAAISIINSPEIGGLSNFMDHESIVSKLSFIPDFSNPYNALIVFIIPITIQWWAAWYPGSEPGGGGYIAQRMLAAKSEKGATAATLLFNFFHYAIRPWPWILVGLGSLVIYPDIQSMIQDYPNVPVQYIKNDFAYPAMLKRFLPTGVLGLVFASLIAAYMSTVSTQINWGASYLVNDFYCRFLNKSATEPRKVLVGRIVTVILVVVSTILALYLKNALQVFQYMLMIGAGTGLLYILRWFWWRINAWSEIAAMLGALIGSLVVIIIESYYFVDLSDVNGQTILGFELTLSLWDSLKFVFIVVFTTALWLIVTLCTKPSENSVLKKFYLRTKPGGPGWKTFLRRIDMEDSEIYSEKWSVPVGLLCMSLGCISIYSCLFSIGNFLYGNYLIGFLLLTLSVASGYAITRFWNRLF